MNADIELIKGNVKVSWCNLGEGYDGDFNPDDPDDAELLRFDVYKYDPDDNWVTNGWIPVDDASYCTRVEASTPDDQLIALLGVILNEVYDDVIAGNSIKKKCEWLSWIQVSDLQNK